MSTRGKADIEWARAPAEILLPANGLVIWRIDLAAEAENEDIYRPLLDARESARADCFRNERDRADFTCTRAVLKWLLGQCSGTDAARIELQSNANGKPEHPAAHFNVSHSCDWALLAFSRRTPMGIDIEFEKRSVDCARIARRYFALAELEQIDAAGGEEARRQAFFALWTRKEAYVKAIGSGLFRELDAFAAPLGQRAILAGGKKPDWEVCSFLPAPAYAAAVCAHPPLEPLQTCDWDAALLRSG